MVIHRTVTYLFDPAIVNAVSDVIIAAFSVLICFVYWRQLHTMRAALEETRRSNAATEESNKIAERTLELEMRAWLVISPLPLKGLTLSSLKAQVAVINVGRTPATHVVGRIRLGTAEEVPDEISLPEVESPSIAILGPGENLAWTSVEVELNLPYERQEQLKKGHVLLLLYSVAEYHDIFNKARKTTACWQYRFEARAWGVTPMHCRLE
jgi:hypothetical protein